MSVRIHQLSKQVGMENKELIELLRSRGFEVKSASSTVDNISAESLVEEFASTHKAEDVPAGEATVAAEPPKGPILPDGVFVKSAAEIKLEREAAAAAAKSCLCVLLDGYRESWCSRLGHPAGQLPAGAQRCGPPVACPLHRRVLSA